MGSDSIKMELERLSGVRHSHWKQCEKFSFEDEEQFSLELDGLNFDDIRNYEQTFGTLPSSGQCRIFIAQEDGVDWEAMVLTNYISEFIAIKCD